MHGLVFVLFPIFVTFDFIVPKLVQQFLFNLGSKIIVLETIQLKVHSSKPVETYDSDVESAQKNCRCAHQAGFKRSEDSEILWRGETGGFLVFPVPKDELLLGMVDGIHVKLFFSIFNLSHI